MANDTLLTLIAGTLGIDPAEVTEGSDMANTRKWDSLRQIMLMTELETHFGFELSDQQMLETTSVAKIRALLSLQGAARLLSDQLQMSEAR
jgi:acyl carrier protein